MKLDYTVYKLNPLNQEDWFEVNLRDNLQFRIHTFCITGVISPYSLRAPNDFFAELLLISAFLWRHFQGLETQVCLNFPAFACPDFHALLILP